MIGKDFLYGLLENRRSIGKAHGKNPILVVSAWYSEGRFRYVRVPKSQLITADREIERGEDFSSTERVHEIINTRYGKTVFSIESIEGSVVKDLT
jgi:hypothetical protein